MFYQGKRYLLLGSFYVLFSIPLTVIKHYTFLHIFVYMEKYISLIEAIAVFSSMILGGVIGFYSFKYSIISRIKIVEQMLNRMEKKIDEQEQEIKSLLREMIALQAQAKQKNS